MRKKTHPSESYLLITVSGLDSPGITSELMKILSHYPAQLLDISQAVIQKLLSLSFLVFFPAQNSEQIPSFIQALEEKSKTLGLKISSENLIPSPTLRSTTSPHPHYAVTLIADQISAQAFSRVADVLARSNVNIDTIKRLSDESFSCVEMQISTQKPIDPLILRKELLEIATQEAVDIALQTEGLYRRSKRLVVLDMDSTLIQGEVIDELAREKGVYDEVSALTHEAMLGHLDYDTSLKLRCEKLKGLTVAELEKVYERIQITPGGSDLIKVLKKLGYKVAVISGGFTFMADRLKSRLGLDFAYANTLEIRDQKLTGKVIPPIVNAKKKSDLLDALAQQEGISLDQVIAIGDGANDLLMLEKAGLGIAFNAKPVVKQSADLALSQKNLKSILFLLGMTSREIHQVITESH